MDVIWILILKNIRIIARLDIKGSNLIKGIHLEGLRIIGDPNEYAVKYYMQGADELIYMDTVASLYGRNHLSNLIENAAKNIFIPLTVGGGIRTLDDAINIFRSGADKVAINTAAVRNPSLISSIANVFGSQSVVLSIEAKRIGNERWEVYTDGGREPSGLDVLDWAKSAVNMGAGEILLTSIDHEGTRKGFDLSLIKAVVDLVSVPVIASGGMGCPEDINSAVNIGGAAAIAAADIFHYGRASINDVREAALQAGLMVRQYDSP